MDIQSFPSSMKDLLMGSVSQGILFSFVEVYPYPLICLAVENKIVCFMIFCLLVFLLLMITWRF
jgi:hypothetical protein